MIERYASPGRPYLPDRLRHAGGPLPPSHHGAPPCATCRHPWCRSARASTQAVKGGQRREFAAEHRQAALVQERHPGVVLWFGEYTQLYWAATPTGLRYAETLEDLQILLLGYARDVLDTPQPTGSGERWPPPPPTGRLERPRRPPLPPARAMLGGVLIG